MRRPSPSNPHSPGHSGFSLKRLFKKTIGYGLAAACLIWVFHDVRIDELRRTMPRIGGWLLIPAVIIDVLSYYSQGARWKLLLHPTGRITVGRATQAIYAGLFTNEIMPMRAGELVRAYLVSRWISTGVVSIIPSMVIERLFDGIWVGIGIGLTALFVRLPRNLLDAADVLGAVVLISLGLFLYLVFRKEKSIEKRTVKKASAWKPFRLVSAFISKIARGIRDIGISRYFYGSLAASSLILVFQILAFWLVMLAYGLKLSLWAGAAVLLIVHFGTAVPNAPSNVGTYQFFCVLGLTLFGIDKTTATGFSVLVFVVLTIPLWIIGLFAVSRTGMSFREIRIAVKNLAIRPHDKT